MCLATWRMTGQQKRRLLPLYWCCLGASFRLEDARYHSEVWTMMTEEILYARLKEALRDAIARHHLDERSISLKSRGLTPEEAIGRTARTDYSILNGREVMLQARFGEALGQAFTSAPVDFEGSLADVLELDTTSTMTSSSPVVAASRAPVTASCIPNWTATIRRPHSRNCPATRLPPSTSTPKTPAPWKRSSPPTGRTRPSTRI